MWSAKAASALLAAALAAGAALAQPMPEPRVVKVNERVHVLLGPIQHANPRNQGYMINSTVIVGDKGVIVVDSGGSLDVGRHLAAAVRRITDKPVTHVVNTHSHGDHYLGNAAFAGAILVSSESCRRLVLETGADWVALMSNDIGHALPGTTPQAASVTYGQRTRTPVSIGGVRIVFWVPAGSHTAGDMMVYLPDDKVLVTGDVLVNGIVPTLQDGFVRNWIRTLEEIEELGDIRFVPGHGDPMGIRDVAAFRGALARFYAGVKEGYRKGLSEEEIRRTLDLSAWNRLERPYVIGRNVNRAYLEAEADVFSE